LRRMSIGTVLFDQAKGTAVVSLVEADGDRMLPIFIGLWEGTAIARELNRVAAPRPLLHDLFCNVLQGLHAHLEKVVVDSLSDNTFYAQLHLKQHETTIIADARPSDAIALAIKSQAPIYVDEAVLQAAGKRSDVAVADQDRPEPASERSADIQAWLENIRPEDFADPH
jgi:bifunctional DNase/RNase